VRRGVSGSLEAPTGAGVAPDVEIAIIGAGFAGLGMAIRLRQAGRRDFTVLEQAGGVGGTWRDNTYPGAACDVPSHVYSFSFAPNPEWPTSFSGQADILRYLQDCARRYGIGPHLRFGHEVTAARWEETTSQWRLTTTRGELTARYLIAGTGPLAQPSIPALPGLAAFTGPVWHSPRWDHDVALAGARVAVIGTGASAVQFVPEIQPAVAHLDLYQRTPPWVVPRRERHLKPWEHRLFRRVPPAQMAVRAGIYWSRELSYLTFRSRAEGRNPAHGIARRHLEAQVPDPGRRRELTPRYAIGCKRILLSDVWYPAVTAANVTIVSAGIERVTPTGIVGRDGMERPADAIILGTGFRATDPPAAAFIWGRGGRWLKEAWAGGMAAYKGTTVAGYPNLFFLVGPNTGLGHNSMIYMIESQIRYVLGALAAAAAGGAGEIEVRPEAQAEWNARIDRDMAHMIWTTGGCDSWYLDRSGRNTTLWPGFSFRFRDAVRHFDPGAYDLRLMAAAGPVGRGPVRRGPVRRGPIGPGRVR
jgi:cation diffusion facilitator CzcD-associated flavoprotein CzcO